MMVDDAIENAKLVAENSAQKMQIFFERDLALARTLAQGLSVFNELDSTVWQPFFAKMYRPILEQNPHINTLWDSWEYYSYVPNYTKDFGRYCISLFRDKAGIDIKLDRRSLTGDPLRYGGFKKGNQEGIWEPYIDQVLKTEEQYIMTTVAAPIQQKGRFVGIIGVDVTLVDLQKQVEKIRPVEGSYAFLVSMGGIIAAHPDTSFVNKNIADVLPNEVSKHKLLEIISTGKEYHYIKTDSNDNEHLTILVPVKVGKSYSVWSLAYSVPMEIITSKVDKSFYVSLFVGFFGLLLLVIVILFVANGLTKPITLITKTLKRLSMGEISEDLVLNLRTGDEIEEMAQALNYSIQGLNHKSVFSTNIGKGNYSTQLELLSNNDELGKSLIEMQKSLIKAKSEEEQRLIEERKRAWTNEGIAKFGEILHRNSNDQKYLIDELLKNFVKYLGANQGALYLLNEDSDEKHLELVGAYAWERKKLLSKKILVGEGQVGACFHENQTIYLAKVPHDYIKIGSGLGDATPTCVVIVPLKHEAGTLGVLELASFNQIADYQIEFLEKVCQSVANTISVVKINDRTRQLLEKSQEQAEQMQAQEEEMRQNMEELLATQEEMARKEHEMSLRMDAISGLAAIMEYDFNGSILSVNNKVCEITGYTREELLNKHHSILFNNKDFAKTESYSGFWKMMRNQTPFEGILKRKTKEGEEIIIKGYAYPMFDDEGSALKVIEIGVEVNEFFKN
jgi:PAS domain S-box-containing protein